MNRTPFTTTVLIASMLAPSLLIAQEDPGPGWRIVPYAGSYWLDSHDAVRFRNDHSAGLRLGKVIGLSLDFDTPLPLVGFRVGFERTVGADLGGSGGSADVAAKGIHIDARIQPAPRSWAVRPFATFGAERYKLDVEGAARFPFEVHDTNQIASRVGLGVDVDFLDVPLRIEGLFRRYRPEEQDDPQIENMNFAFMAGTRIPIR